MFWIDLIGLVLALIAIFITYLKWSFMYCQKRNLPYLEPKIPFGNLINPLTDTEPSGVLIKRLYDEMKRKKWQHGGIYLFSEPFYMVVGLEYIKNVLTKDFQHFANRGLYCNEKDEPITANLVGLGGPKWQNLRTKLTPTFTSVKIKMMFQTILDCQGNLQKTIENLYEKKQPIDIKELFERYTIDIIGSCSFGLDCNSFTDDDSPFTYYGKKVSNPKILPYLKSVFVISFPRVAKALRIKAFSKDLTAFFTKLVKDNVEYREKHNYTRNDFMQLLIDLKNNKTLTIDEITAQSFIFFLAGYESSSSTMTFALYELAKNQEIQEKVRREINTVLARHEENIPYDAIQDMKYLTQVLEETLRKYPPGPFITRECVKDYKVPGEDVTIEKGTRVIIPILGIHYDEEYYPNPEKFDPERFNEENSRSRHQYAHIPFGEGPRKCIGSRFGLTQSKVGLISLLRKYRFMVNKKTKQPLKIRMKNFVLTSQDRIWLDAEKI